MINTNVEILVNNNPIEKHFHEGKTYIEAKIGSEFSIRIKNDNCARQMAVVSVDGADVLYNRPAGEVKSGYVINAYDSLTVKGYRIDNSTVANFKFGYKRNSYVNTVGVKTNNPVTGKEELIKSEVNCGVLGVRLFFEKINLTWGPSNIKWDTQVPNKYDWYTITSSMDSASTETLKRSFSGPVYGASVSNFAPDNTYYTSNISSKTPQFTAGTEWGSMQKDEVREVEFEPSEIYTDIEIYYLTRDELIALGIDLENRKPVAFPKVFSGGFCSVPKNYKG